MRCQSARGLAQSKTLARIFWRLGKREPSWSAVAFHRLLVRAQVDVCARDFLRTANDMQKLSYVIKPATWWRIRNASQTEIVHKPKRQIVLIKREFPIPVFC